MKCSVVDLISCFTLTLITRAFTATASSDLQLKCKNYCQSELLSTAHDLDPSCNTTCIATQCQLGCAFLSQALVTSCREVCNEIELIGKKPYYCQFGCLRAINESIEEKIKQIGIPPAPYIKPKSLTHTSVRLAWNSGSSKNISFLVQWKYESLSSQWTYYRRERPIREPQILIERLRPYTKYRFRVAYLVSPHSLPVFSRPSVVIQTKPHGVPSSVPKVKRLAAEDSSQIQISWEPPDFSNGPIIAYTLYLSGPSLVHTEVKEISVHNQPEHAADYRRNETQFSYVFPDLKPRTMYTVSISCSNMVGEGPKAVGDVVTKNETTESYVEPEPFALILASRKHIYLQRKDTEEAAEVMFQMTDYDLAANITSLSLHVRGKCVYLADTSGTLWRLSIGNLQYLQAEKILHNNRSRVNLISHLTVDWVNDVLYIAEGCTIKCCNLNGSEERSVVEEVPGNVTDMHVDAFNGYLYWTSGDLKSTGIYRIALRSLDGPPVNHKKAECIHKSKTARIFTLDPEIQRIYIPDTVNGSETILSLSMDGENVTNIRDDKIEVSQLKNVSSIVHFNTTFCWTSGPELYIEEYHPDTDKYYHNAVVFEDDFVSIQVLHSDFQPYPAPTARTETTTLTTTVEDSTYPQRTYKEVPPPPLELKIVELNGAHKITWTPVERYSSVSFGYELWQRCYEEEVWMVVYKGENTYWIPKHEEFTTCAFRVNAFNEYGRGNFSAIANNQSSASVKKLKLALHNNLPYIVAVFIPLLAIVVGFLFFRSATKKLDNEKKIMHAEIVQLPELPGHPHENNAHYLPGDVTLEEDLTAVPQITRNQINFTKFLGSGAFAEVYEGLAHDFCEEAAVKVAIKTLRSGATLEQKSDFLKEAKLMDNFKHKHILKLLGICLDSNPFLIFELMEGGDLLSYLRLNRPEGDKSSPLKMEDLFSISIDVAKGCKYLEEMHYVHRDLAARNCLVSSYNKAERVVKIGDFGLARDIYKNDYYRKEGEGLLPVRWMAPESLTDGVFTTPSDVWSFGVLLWEVLTLGQQPYQARANVEVWNYVRNGGRLVVPSNCPYDLQSLLNKCWNFDAKQRPDFSFCLKVLESAKQKLSMCDLSATSVHNQNYSIYNYTNTVGWPNQSFSSETVAIDDLENVSVHSQNSNYLKPFTSMDNVNVDEDGYKFPYLHLLKQGDKIPEKIIDAFINIETKIN